MTLYTFWMLFPLSGGNISKVNAVWVLFVIESMTFIAFHFMLLGQR